MNDEFESVFYTETLSFQKVDLNDLGFGLTVLRDNCMETEMAEALDRLTKMIFEYANKKV